MLTYVINTSENRIFDASQLFEDKLFELAGYNKIKWMNSRINQVENCAQTIFEQQSHLGADDFRVAVLIDFSNFDKIRSPYGMGKYGRDEEGVEFSLYFPYIEAYLSDHILSFLNSHETPAKSLEVYYIQNGSSDWSYYVKNGREQIPQILSGNFPADSKETDNPLEKADINADTILQILDEFTEREAADKAAGIAGTLSHNDFENANEEGEGTNKAADDAATYADGEKKDFVVYPNEKTLRDAWWALKEKKAKDIYEAEKAEATAQKHVLSVKELRDIVEKERNFVEHQGPVGMPTDWFDEKEKDEILTVRNNLIRYSAFTLYCTRDVSLKFKVSDYPYGAGETMTYDEFYDAFLERKGRLSTISRHHFAVTYTNSPAFLALDLLSLSFYLIHVYEREENVSHSDAFEIDRIKPDALQKMLEVSWNKIRAAEKVIRDSRIQYYDISGDGNTQKKTKTDIIQEENAQEPGDSALTTEKIIEQEYLKLLTENHEKHSFEENHQNVIKCASHVNGQMDAEDIAELNKVFSSYLGKRDDLKESNSMELLEQRRLEDSLPMVSQYPSKSVFDHYVGEKQQDISALLAHALAAEYVDVDFTPEVEKAKDANKRYKEADACLGRAFTADVIAMVCSMILMIVPYRFLQPQLFTFGSIVHYAGSLSLFGGLFVLAFLWQILPLIKKKKQAESDMLDAALMCEAKRKASIAQLRQRYAHELTDLEEKRYKLREMAYLYECNRVINKNVNEHRELLKEIEDRLSGMLTNLGVEPRESLTVSIDDEFDPTKDPMANENGIYKIISLEAIEDLFSKGR